MHKKLKMVGNVLLSCILAMSTTFSNLGIVTAQELDEKNKNIKVLNEMHDLEGESAIANIKLNKNEFNVGERVEIIIDVDNTINEYNSFILNYNNKKEKTLNVYANLNKVSGKYEGYLIIDEKLKEDSFILNSIIGVKDDKSTDDINVSNLFIEQASFKIVKTEQKEKNILDKNGSIKGIAKPIIEQITVDKSTAKHGDKVEINLKFKEGYMGDAYQVYSTYYIEQDHGSFGYGLNFEYNFYKDRYEASFNVSDYMQPGEYKLGYIGISEKESGESIYIESDSFDYSKYSIYLNTLGDTVAPQLESIIIDEKDATVGDSVKFYVKGKDNLGIVNRGQIKLIDEKGIYHYVYLNYNENKDQLEGYIEISNRIPSGKLMVDGVWLSDHSGNGTYIDSYSYDFSDCYINISGTIGDNEGPEILSISVDKKQAQPGDTINVSVEAKDESKIQYVNINFIDEAGKVFSVYTEYNALTKMWEGELSVTNLITNGILSINYINAGDVHGNYTNMSSYDNDFSQHNVLIYNSSDDREGPVLDSITIDKNYATLGEKVTFSIDANDKIGTVSNVSIDINYPGMDEWSTRVYNAKYNNTTQKWEVTINITNNIPEGTVKVYGVSLTDGSGNYTHYGRDYNFSNCNVEVKGTIGDMYGPELVSINVDKKEVGHGDKVEINIEASDKSNVSSVQVEYGAKYPDENGSTEFKYVICYFNPETNKWTGILDITNSMQKGTWEIKNMWLNDEWDNRTYIGKNDYDFSYVDLKLNTIGDNKSPELVSISVDKNSVNKQGKVKIIADIQDMSGVEYAYVYYKNIAADSQHNYGKSVDLCYNESTKMYEGYIYFNDWDESGRYIIDQMSMTDSVGNYGWINSDQYDFSNCNIELTGTIGNDYESPEIKGVTLDKKRVTKNENIKVSIEATDNKSGVKTVAAKFGKTESNEFKVVNCEYNPVTSRFEGVMNITDEDTSGEWMLVYAYAQDNRWNESFEYDINLGFEIYDTKGGDYIAPVLESISVDNRVINTGNKAKVSLKVYDDKSGVNKVDVRYYNKDTNKYTWVNCNYNNATGMFEGYLNTDSSMSGELNITSIYLQDNSYNWDYVYSDEWDFSQCSVTILSTFMEESMIENTYDEAIIDEKIKESEEVLEVVEEPTIENNEEKIEVVEDIQIQQVQNEDVYSEETIAE